MNQTRFIKPTGGAPWAWIRRTTIFAVAVCALPACQQEMARQPYYRPLERSEFFRDGRASRPLERGTIARGQALPSSPLMTGRKPGRGAGSGQAENMVPDDFVDAFPFEITQEVLDRGRQRFTIYCSVCHDPTGEGHGKIPERGFTEPPSFLKENSRGFGLRGRKILLREVPVGYFFEVQTEGFGAMPDYSAQVPPHDRWAIAAYIRVLQLSQYSKLDDLPAAEQERFREAMRAKEGSRE